MIWAKVGAEAVTWTYWVWQHRRELEPALRKLGDVADYAQALVANPHGALRRIGNTLVFGQADGGEQVFAFIEQTSPRLEAIEHAVNGVGLGQQALSASLATLQAVSMVSLGLGAMTHAVLLAQFLALRKRLNRIDIKLETLGKKIDTMNEATLKAGLVFLELGESFLGRNDQENARQRLESSLDKCIPSVQFYAGLLGDVLNEKKVPDEAVRLLSRHLAVALMATVSCQIALQQDEHALKHIEQEIPLLRRATRWVFHERVGKEPARYLVPELGKQVTLSYLAELFRQARAAGAIESDLEYTGPTLFEELRPRLYHIGRPTFRWPSTWVTQMLTDLRVATASVEETNRIHGVESLIKESRASGRRAIDVMAEVRRIGTGESAEQCPYFVWAL